MTKGEMEAIRQIVREEIKNTISPQPVRLSWHPSDEAALEKYLELAIKDWAHNFSRTELAIKYKIAKIIKAEGIKV